MTLHSDTPSAGQLRTATGCPFGASPAVAAPQRDATDRGQLLLRLARSGRDAVSYRIGAERNVLLNHPDHAQHVLGSNRDNYSKDTGANRYFRTEVADGILTADGARWRWHRTLLTPAFRDRQRLAATAREAIAALIARFDSAADTGSEVNLSAAIAEVTLSITTRALFGMNHQPFIEHCAALGSVLDDAGSLLPGAAAGVGPRDALYRQIRDAVSASATEDHGPALSALTGDPTHAGEALHQQMVTLLLAGYETTANSLTWAWILLMQHPDIYGEWQHLLDTDHDRAADLTKALFDETLRLYPSAWLLGRRALADDHVGGIDIPAGAAVTISPFLLHRHPQFWDDAESFRPQRFLTGGTRPTHRYAYIPFGAGHRYCIGSSYAHDEAAMILTALGARYTFQSAHAADARPDHKFVLRAPDPFGVIVRRRS
ncbi:cytochrome P450 [Mycolicibacterium rhodesiae NBB3]|uniref:Cytochrome P450 n=1 Tax=Mycolicibacterium rhodesiae (strain NBB3) TaxID=710685 RepID=G8RIS2_MYCRN|nr:cytochrome P450 [Mycolicibacterium rhodesiae NBB3]